MKVIEREGELRVIHFEPGFRDVMVARELVDNSTAAQLAVVDELESALRGLYERAIATGDADSRITRAKKVLQKLSRLQRAKPKKVTP